MKRIYMILAAMLLLFLCGCKNENDHSGERGIYVYYRTDRTDSDEVSAIGTYFYPLAASADALHQALNRLSESPAPENGLSSAFPPDIRIGTYSIDNGAISVSLTGGYSSLLPLEKTLLRCCLVLTLCELDEVESVNIFEEDRLVEQGLTADILLPESMAESSRQAELTLWFPSADGSCLKEEQRRLTIAQFKPVEEYVLEELLRGPRGKNAVSAIPTGTALRSVHIGGGVCTVDFSEEFYSNRPLNAVEERMKIFSLVNTLTELDGVDSVLITVEGRSISCYSHLSLTKPLLRCEEFTESYLKRQNWYMVNMYMMGADEKLVSVPITVEDLEYPDYAKMTLKSLSLLCSLGNRWGYSTAVAPAIRVVNVETAERICTLELGPEFWSCTESQIAWAVRALSATAIDVGGYEGVRILAGNQMYQDGAIQRKEAERIAD